VEVECILSFSVRDEVAVIYSECNPDAIAGLWSLACLCTLWSYPLPIIGTKSEIAVNQEWQAHSFPHERE
jgi:hypothetical protein